MFIVRPCREGRPVGVLLGGSGIIGIIKSIRPVSAVLLVARTTGNACRSIQKEMEARPNEINRGN